MMSWPSFRMRLGAQVEVYGIATARTKLLNNVSQLESTTEHKFEATAPSKTPDLLDLLLRDRLL